jgi:hypothetical protein
LAKQTIFDVFFKKKNAHEVAFRSVHPYIWQPLLHVMAAADRARQIPQVSIGPASLSFSAAGRKVKWTFVERRGDKSDIMTPPSHSFLILSALYNFVKQSHARI